MTEQGVTHDEFDAAVQRLSGDVDKLAEALGSLLDAQERQTGDAAATEPNRWCWRTVTGQDRTHLWDELVEWVDWFNGRYGTSGPRNAVPPCWPLHPVAVEELTGLMLAWTAAHTVTGPSAEVVAWHDRWLWPCLDRLRTRQGGFEHCTATRHDLRHTVPMTPTSADALAEAMAGDPPHQGEEHAA